MVLGCEKWAGRSDRWIADQCGVSPSTVEKSRSATAQLGQLARIGADGKTRKVPSRETQVNPPAVTDYANADDAECVRYIISTNIHRRHLTDEQRDQIGARLVTMQQGGDRANPHYAGLVGVQSAAAMVQSTPARIERARTIERADPKLAEKVISGEISKGAALRQIKHTQERTKPLPAVTDYANAADSAQMRLRLKKQPRVRFALGDG